MNIPLFLTFLSLLTLIYFIVGWYASRSVTTTTDYYLAGKNLGFFTLTFTLIAAQLGGGMLIGTAQKAYTQGYMSIMYIAGISLGFLLLALGFASKLHSLGVSTTAELFESKYNSPTLKKIASLLSVSTLCGILIAQIAATKTLLISLNIENELFFTVFWAFVIIYTIIGGLRAVALVDTVQVGVIISVFSVLFILSVWHEPLSLWQFFTSMQSRIVQNTTHLSLSMLLPTLVLPALFSLIEQDLAQKFFAARSQRIATYAAFAAGAFMILFALIPIYFGMKAHLLNLSQTAACNPLIPTIELITNNVMAALALCAIIAAITSTADSLLCAISSNIAQDFEFTYVRKYIPNKLTFAKYVTCLTGLCAFLASYIVGTNVIDILIASYEISITCVFVPLMVCLFKKNLNVYAAWGAFICGFIGFIIFKIHPVPLASFISLGLSTLGYIIGSYVAKPLHCIK